jgi:hypothetical protein
MLDRNSVDAQRTCTSPIWRTYPDFVARVLPWRARATQGAIGTDTEIAWGSRYVDTSGWLPGQ